MIYEFVLIMYSSILMMNRVISDFGNAHKINAQTVTVLIIDLEFIDMIIGNTSVEKIGVKELVRKKGEGKFRTRRN